jgi:hypothetical protein
MSLRRLKTVANADRSISAETKKHIRIVNAGID